MPAMRRQGMKWVLAVAFALGLAAFLVYPQATINMGRTYTGPLNVQYANEAGTGTTVNKLAKLTGAPSTAIITAITDTSGIIGIVVSGAGTTGSAQIAFKGKHSCVFDSATTAGHYVVNDTSTAGDCMDAGATYPTSGQPIGVVTSTNGGAGTYEVDLTLGQAQAGGAGGGGIASTYGAYASLPATCATGDLYRTSDSLYEFQCTAANVWTAFYHGQVVVPPPSTGWTTDSAGTTVVDSTNGYEYASFGVANYVGTRYRTAPAAPYTLTALIAHDVQNGGNTTSTTSSYAIGFRDGTGKILLLSLNPRLAWVATTKYTNSTTSGVDYKAISPDVHDTAYQNPKWLRIADDSANLVFSLSIDGFHWVQFDSRARTDFFGSGPTQLIYGSYTVGSTTKIGLLSWSVQ